MHLYFVSHTDFFSRKQLVTWTQKPILVSDVQEGTVWLTLLFSLLIWIHTGSLWLHIYNSVYFMQCISKPNNIETTIFLKFRQIMTQNGLSSWRQHCRNSSKLTGYPGASVNGCYGQIPRYASGIEPAPDSSLHSLASTLGNGFAIQSSEEENPRNIIFSFR